MPQKINLITTMSLMMLWVTSLPASARADAVDDPILVKLMLDQLETRDSGSGSDGAWDAQAWIGTDLTKIWIKTDGERKFGNTETAEMQFLFSKAVASYWEFQIGVRLDSRPSPDRTWAAIGFQGLAPYFFEIDTALFIGESGRTALRLEAEYQLLFTQRLILTPQIETNFFGQNDPQIGVGSGLSEVEAGLRLRYEIRREFAPYIGVNWSRVFGNTADFARAAGQSTSDTQLTIGLRAWF